MAPRLEVRLMRRSQAVSFLLMGVAGLVVATWFAVAFAKTPASDPSPEPADNSYCLVCHLSYETEKLTQGHEAAGVGCATCHGESAKHSGDEDGLTPPDKMFAPSETDGFCLSCHPKEKVLAKDKQKKNEYHKDVFDPKAESHLFCTECHAQKHKMEVRTRKWNKKTGKLLADDGVRMMYKNSPATEGVRPNTPKKKTKIVLVGGPKSHGYMEHEHYAGFVLLAKRLEAAGLGISVAICKDGWPKDESVFDGAAAIAINGDGGAALLGPNLKKADELMKRGVGLAVLHFATIIDKGPVADKVLDWAGGYDEPNWSVVKWWNAEFKTLPAHPITRGVKPFAVQDEWYYHMRFRPNMAGVTPILSAVPPDATRMDADGPHSNNPTVRQRKGMIEHVAWASERPDGVRGFGFTGLHNHWLLAHPQYRKVLLNGIAWCAHVEIPQNGIQSASPTLEELLLNQDEPTPPTYDFEKIKKDMARWATEP